MADNNSSAGKKTKKQKAEGKKRRNWKHDETHGLIQIWGDKKHQSGFEGMKYNSRVWAAITKEFLQRFPGCPYNTWESIKDRQQRSRAQRMRVVMALYRLTFHRMLGFTEWRFPDSHVRTGLIVSVKVTWSL